MSKWMKMCSKHVLTQVIYKYGLVGGWFITWAVVIRRQGDCVTLDISRKKMCR